jgi:hypothetical protein
MERFLMSGKERRRLEVLGRVKSEELSLVKAAALAWAAATVPDLSGRPQYLVDHAEPLREIS